MPHNAAAQRYDRLRNNVTVLQLRTDQLRRQLARRQGLSAADRQWLESALGDVTDTVRALTALVGACGGVQVSSRRDDVTGG